MVHKKHRLQDFYAQVQAVETTIKVKSVKKQENQETKPLPVIVSRPHGGLDIPEEVKQNLSIGQIALYNDCDLWLDQLYDFCPQSNGFDTRGVLAQFNMPIARALIDVNRPLDWLGKPDGPIKSQTSYGETIYKEPLTDQMVQLLLDKYWQPYHDNMEKAVNDHASELKLLIDGHNMAQFGPSAYRDAGIERPLICVANMGDENGEVKPERGWTMCPSWFARQATEIAADLFADMELLEPEPNVTVPTALLNTPFGGSFVLARYLNPEKKQTFEETHGRSAPFGIMIEVNRGLYVGNQNSKTDMSGPNIERIAEIRSRLYKWVVQILELIPDHTL